MRERLLALGAESRGRVFERNLCFDTPDGALRQGDRLLRLRRDEKVRLTYKAPPERQSTEVKIYREIELEVASFRAMAAILEQLGFAPVRTYEKWRESFVARGVHFCLDELPFGHFLEIEGPRERLRPQAERLGLSWRERILADYLAIFEAVCAAVTDPPTAPTFAACADLGRLPPALWRALQAG